MVKKVFFKKTLKFWVGAALISLLATEAMAVNEGNNNNSNGSSNKRKFEPMIMNFSSKKQDIGSTKNKLFSIDLLREAFKNNKKEEEINEIIIKHNGEINIEEMEKSVMALLQEEANAKNPVAQWILAALYFKAGKNSSKETIEKGYRLLKEAADEGKNSRAQVNLGVMLVNGKQDAKYQWIIKPNLKEGFERLRETANKGFGPACYMFGVALKDGLKDENGQLIIPPTPLEALEWLMKAANKGVVPAAYDKLVTMLQNGVKDKNSQWIIAPDPHKSFQYAYLSYSLDKNNSNYIGILKKYLYEIKSDSVINEYYFMPQSNVFTMNFVNNVSISLKLNEKEIEQTVNFVTQDARWKMGMNTMGKSAISPFLTNDNESDRESILSHYTCKAAALDMVNSMETQYKDKDKLLINSAKEKIPFYQKTIDCLTVLSDPSFLKKVIGSAEIFVEVEKPNSKTCALPIFKDSQALNVAVQEDEIRFYHFSGENALKKGFFLTLGNKNVKIADCFLKLMEDLHESISHYNQRADYFRNFRKEEIKRSEEELKILLNPAYFNRLLGPQKQNAPSKIEELKRIISEGMIPEEFYAEKAEKAARKGEDLSSFSDKIMEMLKTTQPRKRALIRQTHRFLPALGEEEK